MASQPAIAPSSRTASAAALVDRVVQCRELAALDVADLELGTVATRLGHGGAGQLVEQRTGVHHPRVHRRGGVVLHVLRHQPPQVLGDCPHRGPVLAGLAPIEVVDRAPQQLTGLGAVLAAGVRVRHRRV